MSVGKWIVRGAWILLAAGAMALLVRAFRTPPVLVDLGNVRRGDLSITVFDEGKTRVRQRYLVSAPIQGRLLRTPVEVGDRVSASRTVVAEIAPLPSALLDPRTRAEAQARVQRFEAALEEAGARAEQARTGLEFARTELERATSLHAQGLLSREALDLAARDERSLRDGLRAAELAVRVVGHELELARAMLLESTSAVAPGGAGAQLDGWEARAPLALTSPIDGVVLQVLEESERTLAPGAPILTVGDTADLEVVAEFLSGDAVRVRPGMSAWIEGWGGVGPGEGNRALRATVRLVSPSGVTKVSALGVEEQRVEVIADPAGDPLAWAALGDGYRVEMRVLLHEERGVLLVPAGALFREQEGVWAVLVCAGGRAQLRLVEVGLRGELDAQVLAGLSEGEQVVLYPSALIEDGTRVRAAR